MSLGMLLAIAPMDNYDQAKDSLRWLLRISDSVHTPTYYCISLTPPDRYTTAYQNRYKNRPSDKHYDIPEFRNYRKISLTQCCFNVGPPFSMLAQH